MSNEYDNCNTNTNNIVSYKLLPESSSFSHRLVPSKLRRHLNVMYKIYNYDKTILSRYDTCHDKYRSVVFSYPENKLLSYSPPKSIEYADFVKKYPTIKDDFIATHKIEGISITLFYDPRIQCWQISTKTNIGGNYWYFMDNFSSGETKCKHTTFYDIFLDALCQPRNTSLNDNVWIRDLPTKYSYSFVLQHPDNIITIPITSPLLYLIAIYEIIDNTAIQVPFSEYSTWSNLQIMSGLIDFPKYYDFDSYTKLESYITQEKVNSLCKGFVIWNYSTGERTTLDNTNHIHAIKLMNISPLFHYQYLCAKYVDKLECFLDYYSRLPGRNDNYKYTISFLEDFYRYFIETLHNQYMDIYIHKKRKLSEVSMQYREYIERLHQEWYLPYKKNHSPVKITKAIVKEYMGSLEPRELLFMFSYLRREFIV